MTFQVRLTGATKNTAVHADSMRVENGAVTFYTAFTAGSPQLVAVYPLSALVTAFDPRTIQPD